MSDGKRANYSKFDYDPFPTGGGDIVYKILGIEQDEIMARSPSIILNKKMRKDQDPNCEIIDEESDVITPSGELDNLRNLLQQEDLRGLETQKNIRNKMKKIKSNSKNIINKKINSLKSMRSFVADDEASLHESHSDISLYKPTASLRSSAAEIGEKIIKKVKRSKPNYQRSSSDGVGMAALLVRSMMAAPSLDSIAENTDPTVHASKHMSRIDSENSGSLISLPTNKHHKHRPENKLNIRLGDSIVDLKASDSNLSSNMSMSSPSISESSSEDDNCSEMADGGVVMIDADTISM